MYKNELFRIGMINILARSSGDVNNIEIVVSGAFIKKNI